MTISKPDRSFCLFVLAVFSLFIFRGTILAKRPPNTINLKIAVKGKFRWKKQGDKIIPVDLTIGGKAFKFVQQGGKWGIKAPLKDLIERSPECRNALHLALGEIALVRIRDIIKGDKAKAQQLVNDYKALKKAPDPGDPPAARGPCAYEAADSALLPAVAGAGDMNQQDLMNAYNQMLGGEAFLYPMPQPGIGGWALVSGEDEGSGGGSEEGEEEEGGFFSWLATVICVLAVIVAPILAVLWLAATAITIATATIAFLGLVGALGVAGIVGSTLNVVDDIINGRPLIQIWN